MSNNDPFEMPDDETLSPELAAFEKQLKSLKPVAFEMAAGNAVSAANGVTGMRVTTALTGHSVRSLRDLSSFPAAVLFPATIVTLVIVTALLLFWSGRGHLPNNPPQYIPGNGHQIAEIQTPEPMHFDVQPLPTVIKTPVFRGDLTMRKQLAMLLDEMQPQGIAAIEPKQPDYPVMVIPVCQDARPLSPEAKQALQRRLHGGDYEMRFALWN